MKRNLTLNLVAAFFIFLFTYTALSKLLSFKSFQYTLGQLPVIGSYSSVIAILLPFSELLVAAILFFPSTRRTGLWASFLFMILFTVYIACAIMLDLKLPCSCGGVFSFLSWRQHLWVNLFLTLLASMAVHMQAKTLHPKSNFSLQ